MAISPWYVGQVAPAWIISLVPDSGVVNVVGLTPGSFSLRIHNGTTGTETTGGGIFSNITAAVTVTANGQTLIISHATVQYQPVSGDAVAGTYKLWVDVTFSNGTQPFLIGDWQVISE